MTPRGAGPPGAAVFREGNGNAQQPTNKVLPVQISFPPKMEGTVRIAAWNICGLAAAQKKVRGLEPCLVL